MQSRGSRPNHLDCPVRAGVAARGMHRAQRAGMQKTDVRSKQEIEQALRHNRIGEPPLSIASKDERVDPGAGLGRDLG